jgi:predicted  nucleic acid-binding Zn-ribbon protein
MTPRDLESRAVEMWLTEMAAAQTAARDRVPHARAELREAEALFERNVANAREATRSREAADDAIRVAMNEAVTQPFEEAVKNCSRKRDEQRTAKYVEEIVAAHQEPRESGRLADGLRIGRKLAGVAVHG